MKGYHLIFFALIFVALFFITGCGTIGGAVDGAGDDLNRAGKWIENIGKDDRRRFTDYE
tara:strand:+ start:1131 stop:1307 length:177 start_codon:yes stop_codon:yes gene_type:complete